MSDKTFNLSLSVDELRVLDLALKGLWVQRVEGAAEGPEACRNLFAALTRNGNNEGLSILEKEIRKLSKEWTTQARTADSLRQRVEPLLEEWEERSRVDTTARGQATGCGGGGGL